MSKALLSSNARPCSVDYGKYSYGSVLIHFGCSSDFLKGEHKACDYRLRPRATIFNVGKKTDNSIG